MYHKRRGGGRGACLGTTVVSRRGSGGPGVVPQEEGGGWREGGGGRGNIAVQRCELKRTGSSVSYRRRGEGHMCRSPHVLPHVTAPPSTPPPHVTDPM